jgi:hypothetical protein
LREKRKTKRGKDGSKTGKKAKKKIQDKQGAQAQPSTEAEKDTQAKRRDAHASGGDDKESR